MKEILLKMVQLFHLLNELFVSTYIIWFPTPKYDLYFAIYVFIITIHWYFLKNECVISYMEKKLLNDAYELGQEPYYHPFQSMLPRFVHNIFMVLKIINIVWVLCRNYKKNKSVFIIMVIVLIINLYLTFKKFIVDKQKF